MVCQTYGLHFHDNDRNHANDEDNSDGLALYGPIPVKTETFRKTFRTIGPCLFLGKFVWTNGPESSSEVSPCTALGPWMALPRIQTD